MKINKKVIYDNLSTLFYALIIAIIIRSLLFQPFYIPSSSMEPTLLVGDRLFVSKYTYGYSKHSFPFSPNISNDRFFFKVPKRGDVVVFKTPADNRTDYIKRLIGLPGDEIQFIDGNLYLNNNQILRTKKIIENLIVFCGEDIINVNAYDEKLPNGHSYTAVYKKDGSFKNSDKYIVPKNHYFFLGDNRDCSKDSRYLNSVGYVNKLNLVGKARIIFFSTNKDNGSIFQIWKWFEIIQWKRFFDIIN
jgi:signal peptidase I